MSRRGICLIWFRGRHIPPSMPYREARSVAESSEGPTASKSDRTGRNPGMTRLVRRSSAGVWRYCVFLSCSNIPSAHAQIFWLYEMRIGHLPLSWNGRVTQNSFWAWTRQLEEHETGARPEEKVRRKFLARYYRGTQRICSSHYLFPRGILLAGKNTGVSMSWLGNFVIERGFAW